MKNKLYIFSLIFLCVYTKNYAQEIISSVNGNKFIEGIKIDNKLSIKNPSNNADSYMFYIQDSTGTVLDSISDNTSSDGYFCEIDMGNLKKNYSIYAQSFKSGVANNDYIENYSFTIIPKPKWLIKGSVENINISNSTLTFEGKYPIYKYDYTIDNSILLIGNKPLNLAGNFTFNTEFDLTTGQAKITENSTQITMNVLDYSEINESLKYSSTCNIDSDLNISVIVSDEIKSRSVNFNSPAFRMAVCPGISVKIDASIELFATLKGQIVVGQVNNDFGFIESNNKKTKVIGVLTGIGTIRGRVSVGLGTAKATLSLIAKANLGVGFDYVSIPSEKFTPLYGGDLDISGEISVNAFAWFGDGIQLYEGSKSFLRTSFGDTSALRSNHDRFNTRSVVIRDSGTMNIPDFTPQPNFCNRDSNLYAVWLENNYGKNQLLLSKLNKNGTRFSNSIEIQNHDFPINNPKVGVLSNGNALISWTQNRYNRTNIPFNISAEDIFKAQDIWFAFYDNQKDSITFITKLSDDSTGQSTGRSEGEATISVNNKNEALITWTSANTTDNTSDIWYTHISKSGENWEYTTPEKLIDLPGVNSNVNVILSDNSTAFAMWVNDPDGDVETLDNNIVFAGYDSQKWDSKIVNITQNDGSVSYDALHVAYQNDKALIAYTSSEFKDNNSINKINGEVFDFTKGQWDNSFSFKDEDSLYNFQKPSVSISDKGLASISYQVTEKYADTSDIDNGFIYLFVADLEKGNSWNDVSNETYLSDTNTYIWDLTTGFGNDNRFYTMSQEYNDNGVISSPEHGIIFGDPELSLVLRGYQFDSNLTINDIEEPKDVPAGIKEKEIINESFFNVYPNPFSTNTTIEFSLASDAATKVEVYTATGEKITTIQEGNLSKGSYKLSFFNGDIPDGIYYLKLIANNQVAHKKIVIIK